MTLENDNLISVGIDIGTATTQIVFSRLVIKNTAGLFSIPKIEIVDKTIVYKSRIYFTPLIDDKIDILSVEKILETEFKKSGFHKENIKSGAIIITGESARKDNARKAVDFLSESAGNFVVAAAGSDLEAILAGKGAGAKEISEKRSNCVFNLDIGGGTTNACLFDSGRVADTFALDIGGRVVKIKEDGTVIYVSDKIKPLIDANHYTIKEGFKTTFSQLSRLCEKLAEILTMACGFAPINEAFRSLFIDHLPCGKPSDIITFSGGVAECIYSDQAVSNIKDTAKYGDIGPLLAQKIRETFKRRKMICIKPAEKIRATVIGAGNYAMQISGSTVYFDEKVLPIKNLPVVCAESGIENLYEEVIPKIKRLEGQPVALAFAGLKSPSYTYVKEAAAQIYRLFFESGSAVVVLVEHDFAKALGQLLHQLMPLRLILCADGICASDGDYVDIGFPVRQALPIVVKTLVFS